MTAHSAPADQSVILRPGPWSHRFVPANGARFHVTEAGEADAPLIMLLHGFPQMWWCWRDHIPALVAAGYRVAAMDLRGFGASDKPPHGYDTGGLARDVSGVIRSLGARDATIIGQGVGGSVAWSMPALFPQLTRAIASLAMPHPLHLRSVFRRAAGPGVLKNLAIFQVPFLPERLLRRQDLAVALLRQWGSPDWLDDDNAEIYREAARVPFVPYGSMEHFRWLVRSIPRADGRRFNRGVRRPVTVPALQIHGERDPCLDAKFVKTSVRYAGTQFRFEILDGVGHFPAEEATSRVGELLRDWLAEVDSANTAAGAAR
ncbi:MAG TPA: alpha/beta hydrolase [Actinomycetales bacterium]|nr:alpha/beta hydrolase [Actinomycetales bacterium]